ncbi:hypothetical protein GP5015_907 [gamma proteobacterium HTCC5015]|nr:hypothetical protein GP5015_907 [gamma proteobacterium HTCC5015]
MLGKNGACGTHKPCGFVQTVLGFIRYSLRFSVWHMDLRAPH